MLFFCKFILLQYLIQYYFYQDEKCLVFGENIYIAKVSTNVFMDNDVREKRTKSYSVMRSVVDFTMGILYLSAAFFLFFAEKFGFSLDTFDKAFRYVFGGICAVYGSWRIYRGFKKDYF